MKKNVTDILDIHTHKQGADSPGKSIINVSLWADSSLYMPLAEGREVAAGGGSYYSIGIHPWEVKEDSVSQQLDFLQRQLSFLQQQLSFLQQQLSFLQQQLSFLQQQQGFLQQQWQGKPFVAIGEAGLDKLAEAPMELQLAVFQEQVKWSEKLGLPLIIHCVKAMEELLAVKKECRPQQPWIWHGFRGKPEQAVQLLKKGFYLSFGEHYPDETMRIVPDERLFLETDDSLLTIEEVLYRAAGVRGVEVEALRGVICRNVQNVFFKA